MILYHGSNEIVKHPMILVTDYTKDFGWGFYTTASREQAEKWAQRRALHDGKAIVNTYEYTPDSNLHTVTFADTTIEWLDFVAACRTSKKMPHQYDIVSGPMADDTIWNYVNDYLNGEISKEAFLELCRFRHPTQQTSFHTVPALLALKFVGAEEV